MAEDFYEETKRLLNYDPDAVRFGHIIADLPTEEPDMSTTTPLPVAEAEVPVHVTLTAADRCDRCGAQAYTRAKKDELEVLFCAHHTKEHGDALVEKGFTVTTETVPA